MNWLFGVAITLPPLLFVVFLVLIKHINPMTAVRFSIAYVLVVGFYAGMTYGPRSELPPVTIQYSPEHTEVKSSDPIFDTERTRIGQFDERLKEEAPEKE